MKSSIQRRCWILDLGFWGLGIFWVLNFWLLDFEVWLLEFGFWILDLEFSDLFFGVFILDSGARIFGFGFGTLNFWFFCVLILLGLSLSKTKYMEPLLMMQFLGGRNRSTPVMFSFLPVPFEPISTTVVLGVSSIWLHGRFLFVGFYDSRQLSVKDSQRMLIHMNKQKETLAPGQRKRSHHNQRKTDT